MREGHCGRGAKEVMSMIPRDLFACGPLLPFSKYHISRPPVGPVDPCGFGKDQKCVNGKGGINRPRPSMKGYLVVPFSSLSA
jgi:hypothetical protein